MSKPGSLASKLPSATSILPPSHQKTPASKSSNNHTTEVTSAESGISDTSQPGGGGGGGGTSSTGRKYERRTKRFIWPDELHRLFVAAVFDVGLKNASPKALLALMGNPACMNGLTTEHLKSHLQKYRLNYDRSRVEFLKYFDESVSESTKQQKRKGRVVPQGAVASLFPIMPKRKRSLDDMEEEASSDDDDVHPDEKVAKVVAAASSISRQLDVQSKTLKMQAQFQEEIQQQLYEQALLQRQLQERLAEVTVHKGTSPHHHLPHPISALSTSTGALARTSTAFHTPTAPAATSAFHTVTRSNNASSVNNPLQEQLNQLAQLGEDTTKDRAMSWSFPLIPAPSGGGAAFISPSMHPGVDPSPSTSGFSLGPSQHQSAGGASSQLHAPHIQMQMTMQQQMRLHQHMLQRKVEVSQQSSTGSTGPTGSSSNNSTNNSASVTETASGSMAPTSTPPLPATSSIAPLGREPLSFRSQLNADWTDHKEDDHGGGGGVEPVSMSEGFAWDLDDDMNDDLFGFLK
ncbi:hypothetical protein DYB32_006661 [Aphanomyces invadans]|uniref:HTH myb-type domain-containing protein n=1 Tax=Aphanomyces invadans TaxID=157072 RepID=A0A3R6Y608_9STRA|nr:hypothetical protein DYB32_006661 [Aphanomyces invadans]